MIAGGCGTSSPDATSEETSSGAASTDDAQTPDNPDDDDAAPPTGGEETDPTQETSATADTSSVSESGNATTSGGASGACAFPEVTDFGALGPFEVTTEPGGSACTVYRPTELGEGGRLHPVVLWGNGTTLSPMAYGGVLQHWASHGFIVAAANTTNAGTGTEMLGCLDWVTAQDADATTPYAAAVDLDHVGASGHSQGGGGTLMAGQDPRLTVTAPLQPYTEQGFGGFDQASLSNQNGPMFLMSGDVDTFAPPIPNQQRTFDAANVPVLWGTLAGADHLLAATGNISGYRAPATAWFRYHLMCDETARPLFYDACTLCADPQWTVETKNW